MIVTEEEIQIIQNFTFPKYNEIPDVGLFLEQVTKYVNDYLAPLKGVNITSSMISNYVKKKLISNPVKKQYSREQIAYIFFIAVAKSVLSLEEIEMIINLKNKEYDCDYLYGYFCDEFINVLHYVFGLKKEYVETRIEMNEDRYLFKNAIITAAHKIYLDTIFACKTSVG